MIRANIAKAAAVPRLTESQFAIELGYGERWKFKQGPVLVTSREDVEYRCRTTHWTHGYSEMVAKKGGIEIAYRQHFSHRRGDSDIQREEHNMGSDRKRMFFALKGVCILGRNGKPLDKFEEWQFFRGTVLFLGFFPRFEWPYYFSDCEEAGLN